MNLPAREAGHEAIARVWAREKIAWLSRASYRTGDSPETIESIVHVALTHHLLSRYTSLVAVDETPTGARPASAPVRVAQPADAPQGVNVGAAGGAMTSTVSALPAAGAVQGGAAGDTFGYGGLGFPGTGAGGGGAGVGTIGPGIVGLVGSGVGQSYGADAGRGLRGRVSAGPTVHTAVPVVSGMLSPEVIRRVIHRKMAQVVCCYEQGLAQDPQLAGRVVVRLVIRANGTVTGVTVADTTLHAPAVEACVANTVRRWQFPAPPGGGVVTVSYPFVFSLGDVGSASPAPARANRPRRAR